MACLDPTCEDVTGQETALPATLTTLDLLSRPVSIETEDGRKLGLRDGGSKLAVDGQPRVEQPMQEYERIYARFAELLDRGESDMDAAPLQLVADAYLIGHRIETDDFDW